jgi:hypothetical protein
MYEIRIPDEVYRQAAQAADAQHVSLEDFVTEILQLHLQEGDAAIQRMFTPERLAHIAKAEAEIDAGLGLTPQQARADFATKRAEWLRANQR